MVSLWDVLPVVSTLDTLPACEGVGCAACGGQFPRCCLWMVSLWDVLPVPVGLVAVVSTLDTLPACEPVPCFVACFCWCCAVVLFRAHVLFICVPWSLSVGWSACGCGGQFPRCCVSVWDGLPVAAGMVCLWWSVPSVVLCVGRVVCHSSSGEGVPWWCRMVSLWDGVPQFQR